MVVTKQAHQLTATAAAVCHTARAHASQAQGLVAVGREFAAQTLATKAAWRTEQGETH